jgi:hypothetical protein
MLPLTADAHAALQNSSSAQLLMLLLTDAVVTVEFHSSC